MFSSGNNLGIDSRFNWTNSFNSGSKSLLFDSPIGCWQQLIGHIIVDFCTNNIFSCFQIFNKDHQASVFYMKNRYCNCASITSKSQVSENCHWHISVMMEDWLDRKRTSGYVWHDARHISLNEAQQELTSSNANCWPFFSEVSEVWIGISFFCCTPIPTRSRTHTTGNPTDPMFERERRQ